MKNHIKTIFLLVFIILSCNQNEKTTPKYTIRNTSNDVENFDQFNIRFHTDSIFQLSRIAFPIGGKSIDGSVKKKWTLKNWEMRRSPVVENPQMKGYEHSLVKSNTFVIEKYWIKNGHFSSEIRFKRIKNKWFLIYYNNMNL